jgi:transcriptional regulator with XRE-family HTH domain
VDVCLLIRQRLAELDLDQKELAVAAQVTDSYISQLLARKKLPPAPGRTDIYEKIAAFLKLPAGELPRLAEVQRRQELRKRVSEPPGALLKECRDLILRKCGPARRTEVRRIFEKEPFGELERLVTQKLLDVAQGVAREELRSDSWLRALAELAGCSYEQMRVAILEFLDTDVFGIAVDHCASFLDPIIESWDIDIRTFGLEITLNGRLAPGRIKRFDFVEKQSETIAVQPGLKEFLKDASLCRDITEEEVAFLTRLRFDGRQPTPLYYYRELQNLRDPLHFRPDRVESAPHDAACHRGGSR